MRHLALYDGNALTFYPVEETISGHLPPAASQRAPAAIRYLYPLTTAVTYISYLSPFLGPHQHRLLQPEPVHVIALLAVRLHGDHEAATPRIDTQPNPLLQLRGVGNAARHQPLTGNGENLVARL